MLVIRGRVIIKQFHHIGRVGIHRHLAPSLRPALPPSLPAGDGEEEVAGSGDVGVEGEGALEGGDGLRKEGGEGGRNGRKD